MTVAVVTVVHGRDEHRDLQHAGLVRSSRRPDMHVVVAMDDRGIEARLGSAPFDRHVVHVPRVAGRLPLARARNVGARRALEAGATVLVFLDVDCIPVPGLVGAYEDAAHSSATGADLLCGPVTYLPPPPESGYDLDTVAGTGEPHPARPAPAPGVVERSRDGYDLFWSLSFATTAGTWSAIGGFDEAYTGYGGEDTDFGRRAAVAGRALAWVGAARAHHQHHPVSSPPVEHVVDVVRNARVFHDRWGEWPMQGWLDAFEELGLVRRGPDGTYVVAADHFLPEGE